MKGEFKERKKEEAEDSDSPHASNPCAILPYPSVAKTSHPQGMNEHS
jgi:hypothetical protein